MGAIVCITFHMGNIIIVALYPSLSLGIKVLPK